MPEPTNPSRMRTTGTTALVVAIALLAMSSATGQPASARASECAHDQSEAARAVAAVVAAARDLLRPTQPQSGVLHPVIVAICIDAESTAHGSDAQDTHQATAPVTVLGPRVLDLPPPAC